MDGLKRAQSLMIARDMVSRVQGATILELMKETRKSRRSVYRLLEDLPGIGCPVRQTSDPIVNQSKVWHRISF